ncbi:MAG: hypothetical protein EOP21_06120 [Hyphomicrobiales bacterium]|nr:MAG: hypothetical protein EOP21_06120 [Hyphomicrobiales bacterium]
MRYFKAGLVVAGAAWFLLIGSILFWNFAPSDNFLGLPTVASGNGTAHATGSLGKRRHLMLVEATRVYGQSGVKVSPGIADGTDFAPVPFLNRELKRQDAKWRVRSTSGLDAEIYEIS